MTDLIAEPSLDSILPAAALCRFREGACCWFIIAAVGGIDAVWLWRDGIAVANKPFARLVLLAAYFAAIAWLLCQWRPNLVKLAAARVFAGAAQVLSLVIVIAPLSYLIDDLHMSLADPWLRAVDAALGFDWPGYADFILRHPLATRILANAYSSMELQILVILTVCCAGAARCETEFLQNYALTMLLCVVIGGLLPALGEPSPFQQLVHAEFLRVRSGDWKVLDYGSIEGIVAFPSFHTAFAIIAVYSVRRCGPALLVIGFVNLLLVASIPICGGHYLTDMIGGAAVAIVSITVVRAAERWRRKPVAMEAPASSCRSAACLFDASDRAVRAGSPRTNEPVTGG